MRQSACIISLSGSESLHNDVYISIGIIYKDLKNIQICLLFSGFYCIVFKLRLCKGILDLGIIPVCYLNSCYTHYLSGDFYEVQYYFSFIISVKSLSDLFLLGVLARISCIGFYLCKSYWLEPFFLDVYVSLRAYIDRRTDSCPLFSSVCLFFVHIL